MIIIVLAIVSLMVALDATILVPVLPVSAFDPSLKYYMENKILLGNCK